MGCIGNIFSLSCIVPILKAHGINIMSSLLLDSRTSIELTWDPADILPLAEDPTAFYIDVYVYSYNYVESKWMKKNVFRNHENSGQVTIGMVRFSDNIQATCIHVTVGSLIQSTSNVRGLVEALNSADIAFPSRVGLWTGLLFSIENNRELKDKEARANRDRQYNDACDIWSSGDSTPPVDMLPPCPPTQDRAELPNSGLELVNYRSSLYSTNYHKQWMQIFHPDAATCFAQASVVR